MSSETFTDTKSSQNQCVCVFSRDGDPFPLPHSIFLEWILSSRCPHCPADFHIILRNLGVGVGSFCSLGHPHWHTSTLPFLHHTLHFLSSHTPFVPVILFFYGFCFAGCLELTDSSWMSWLRQAGSWVCRLPFRAPLWAEPTQNSHTPFSYMQETFHTAQSQSFSSSQSAFICLQVKKKSL